MIIDTHCHYNLEPLVSDWKKYWAESQQAGVKNAIVVGTNPHTSQIALDLCDLNQNFKATLGIHPKEADTIEIAEAVEKISQLLEKDHPGVVAVGEIGLDYFRHNKQSPEFAHLQAKQHHLFVDQLNLAKRHDLPVILHVRDTDWPEDSDDTNAYWQVAEIMYQHWSAGRPFVLHCFSGPLSYAQEMIKLGGYIGIDGNITYKNADPLRQIINQLPKDRILLETDAPFLPPVPHRGKKCEPAMIKLTGTYLAEHMQISPQQIIQNTNQVFFEHK